MDRQNDILNVVKKINGTSSSSNEVNSSNNEDSTSWYNKDHKFLHNVLGQYVLEHCHVKKLGGVLYIYNANKRTICYRRY